ncbi:response regulator transcription factor [Phytohabitans suffuscus]|uniref:Response regulatory domain-containing protein n=1 Tax=Phytohabitans suffuscus TaxID=624315 RepID=A0A6F8YKF3_9ACTN|nr:response regulator transcription factor [Phytohabitans suffuscus]BCB86523.1 hypothetical protein Psuf_038360 [Phytohabitans suffuscus]
MAELLDGHPSGTPTTVLIVHPDPRDRAAIRAELVASGRLRVVGVTGDRDEAVALAGRLRPTVSLLDDRVRAPGTDLVEALARWSLVIVLTDATERDAVVTLLQAPVQGCLVYGHIEPPDLVRAVNAVASGLGWLSPSAAAAVTWAMRASTPRPAHPGRGSSHLDLP